MIVRTFRFRLYPTVDQVAALEATANARRYLYNLALEQRRDYWRQAKAVGVRLNSYTQGRELTLLRRDLPWLAKIHTAPLTYALRDLDRAFANFFAGRAKFPSFQSKERAMSFRHKGRDIRFEELSGKWTLLRVPSIGHVKMRVTRPIIGRCTSATFVRDALGWHVALVCEIEQPAPLPSALPSVGIDRGVANTLALSTGELLSTTDTAGLERLKNSAKRRLARRQRGSRRYALQRAQLGRICAKIARVRSDWQHRSSTDIANRFGFVGMEDLNTSGMVRGNRGLARSILAQGWHGFETKLAYKLEERGGTLVKINPAYTSQECAACGTIDKASRESQASFACRHCGFAGHADTNAALNILRRSTARVEGAGCGPVEAQTERVSDAPGAAPKVTVAHHHTEDRA